MKNNIYRTIGRMFARRRWLFLFFIIPFLLPIKAAKPFYRVSFSIQLHPPEYIDTHSGRLKWATNQIEKLASKSIIEDAYKMSGFSEAELKPLFPRFMNGLDVSLQGDSLIECEIITSDLEQDEKVCNELIDLYLNRTNNVAKELYKKKSESVRQRLASLKIKLLELESSLQRSDTLLKKFRGSKDYSSVQLLRQQVEGMRKELKRLESVYTTQHPEVKGLSAELAIKKSELEVLEKDEASFRSQEKKLLNNYATIQNKIEQLYSDKQSIESELEGYTDKELAMLSGTPESSNLAVMETWIVDVLGKSLLGILGAFFIGFFFEGIDKSIWNETEVKCDTGVKPLGVIPKHKGKSASGLLANFPKDSKICKSIEELRSYIQFVNLATTLRVIQYASMIGSHDFLSGNLAISISSLGARVLLVNVSGDTCKYNKIIKEEGYNTLSLNEIYETKIENLSIVNIAQSDFSKKEPIDDFIKRSLESFDNMIIDTPSLKNSMTSAAFSSVVDGVIIGARAKRTRRADVIKNYTILNQVNARVLGVILQC